jgi:hypothetical protein
MRAGLEQGRQCSVGVFRLDTDKIAEVPEDHAVDVVAHFVVQENEGNLRTAHGLTGDVRIVGGEDAADLSQSNLSGIGIARGGTLLLQKVVRGIAADDAAKDLIVTRKVDRLFEDAGRLFEVHAGRYSGSLIEHSTRELAAGRARLRFSGRYLSRGSPGYNLLWHRQNRARHGKHGK